MAQATTRKASGSRASSSKSGSKRSSTASPKSNGRSSRSTSTKARASTKAQAKRAPRSQASRNGSAASVKGTADSVKGAVTNTAQDAADGIATVAKKAKVPLLASGAALAGVAGAVIATRSGKRRKVMGISMPKRNGVKVMPKRSGFKGLPKRSGFKADATKVTGAVTDAAQRAEVFGQRVTRVAGSVRNVSETANEAVKKT
jgi:hypothetical protein